MCLHCGSLPRVRRPRLLEFGEVRGSHQGAPPSRAARPCADPASRPPLRTDDIHAVARSVLFHRQRIQRRHGGGLQRLAVWRTSDFPKSLRPLDYVPRQSRDAVRRRKWESRHRTVRGRATQRACADAPHLVLHPAVSIPRFCALGSPTLRSPRARPSRSAQKNTLLGWRHRRHPPRRPRADDGAHFSVRARVDALCARTLEDSTHVR